VFQRTPSHAATAIRTRSRAEIWVYGGLQWSQFLASGEHAFGQLRVSLRRIGPGNASMKCAPRWTTGWTIGFLRSLV
jgi:hypothetical protein